MDSLVRAVSLKFEEMGPLADWFVERLADVVLHQATKLQADLAVPVPLHKDRRRERDFNEAELLSKRLAKRLEISSRRRASGEKRTAGGQALADNPASAGSRFVVLLPHIQAAKLTIDASYW